MMKTLSLSWLITDMNGLSGGKRIYADAFILWNTAGGEYKGYGDSRFQNLKLTKKK